MDLVIEIIGLAFLNYISILYFVYEDGPYEIFEKIRFFSGINKAVMDINGDIVEFESNGRLLANILSCHKCFGFWAGLFFGLFSGNFFAIPIIIGLGIYLHE